MARSSSHLRAPLAGALLALALGVTGCATVEPLAPPPEFDAETAGIPGQVELLFDYLAGGQAGSALRMTDLAIDENAPDAPLLGDDAYGTLEQRPTLESVGEPEISDDGTRADVEVRYAVGGAARSETLELSFVEEVDGVPAHWVFVVDPARAGFDAAGATELPADTLYSVNGVDVTAAFSNLSASSPRVMAFAGTYPLQITAPDGESGTVTIEIDSVFGATGAGLTEFATPDVAG